MSRIAARRCGRASRFVRSAAGLWRMPARSAAAPWSRAGRTARTAAHRLRRRELWRRPPRLPTVILNVYRNRCTAWSVSPCDTVMIERCIPAGFAGKTTLSPRKGALHGRLFWCPPPAGGSIRLFCRGPVPRTDVATTIAGGGLPATPAAAVGTPVAYPHSVVADSSGNLYFTAMNCVFQVDPGGTATRVAGNSASPGYSGDGGPATSAQFSNPQGPAIDGAGNLYVADSGNGTIRRIGPNGVITSLILNGSSAYFGVRSPLLNPSLDYPTAVAVDGSGNLYIAEPAGPSRGCQRRANHHRRHGCYRRFGRWRAGYERSGEFPGRHRRGRVRQCLHCGPHEQPGQPDRSQRHDYYRGGYERCGILRRWRSGAGGPAQFSKWHLAGCDRCAVHRRHE